jgi:hypothetical protein
MAILARRLLAAGSNKGIYCSPAVQEKLHKDGVTRCHLCVAQLCYITTVAERKKRARRTNTQTRAQARAKQRKRARSRITIVTTETWTITWTREEKQEPLIVVHEQTEILPPTRSPA